MNKKGDLFGIFGVCTLFVLIFVVIILAQTQNNSNFSREDLNRSLSGLNWGNYSFSDRISNYTNGEYYHDVIITIAFKYIDLIGYSVFELTKMACKFAYDNPNIISWKLLFALIILGFLAPLIYPLFIITVSIILLIKEWLQIRKEKKLMIKLKGGLS